MSLSPTDQQAIFDAVLVSIEVHAPEIRPERKIALATDVALKATHKLNEYLEFERLLHRGDGE